MCWMFNRIKYNLLLFQSVQIQSLYKADYQYFSLIYTLHNIVYCNS